MSRKPKQNIIPQMFDVRPVNRSGRLDWERIRSVGTVQPIDRPSAVDEYVATVFPPAPERSDFSADGFYEREFLTSGNGDVWTNEEYSARVAAEREAEARREEERRYRERLETERAEAARREAEREEEARREEGRLFEARIAAEREREARFEEERLLRIRLAAEREEAARIAAEQERQVRLEEERRQEAILAAKRQEEAWLVAEREETFRLAAEQAEQARLEEERRQAAILEAERQEAARLVAEQEEVARIAAEREAEAQREKERKYFERLEEKRVEARLEASRKAEAEREEELKRAATIEAEREQDDAYQDSTHPFRVSFITPYFLKGREAFENIVDVFGRYRFSSFRFSTVAAVFLAVVIIGGVGGTRLLTLKGKVLGDSTEGMEQVSKALDQLIGADFSGASKSFADAKTSFSDASGSLGPVGNTLAKGAQYIPFLSKFSSGQGLIEGAGHLSSAGESLTKLIALMPGASGGAVSKDASFLTLVGQAETLSDSAQADLDAAQKALQRVNIDDVPEEKRATFQLVRDKLPAASAALAAFREHSSLVRELLGQNGPRMYLFLFQNNDELRPTGGFIGSYGLLEVNNGRIKKFFVDGIFNPDGQLRTNIIPPAPVRKISAAWSLHDSNWWPDFPTSAEKAISFYEKTGGPTVDGVVTLTPTVIKDILKVTGPVEMPDYGVTIDSENFTPVIQEEVEVNYDRERNKPKQILADLAPILLDRLFQTRDAAKLVSILDTMSSAMSQRQILLYSRNKDVESLISKAGWSGELLSSSGDYASVVHTNLNGFKTDGVISESVEHTASIRADGSVLDTIRITRKHNGGNTKYDWWNRVNADYMRVYVPLGSELVSATGQTYEIPNDPVDYAALGFTHDPDVDRDEKATTIRDDGTRVSEESGKTVFGNFVYVSPGESVTVEYTYLLPFMVFPKNDDPASYAFLYQKQAGVGQIDFHHQLTYPDRFTPVWHSTGTDANRDGFVTEGPITRDAYSGVLFFRP